MPRIARVTPGGFVFHVLNRGNERRAIFESEGDYLAFLRVMAETAEQVPLRILGWCLMPNHWHLLLWPREDDQLGRFMQRLTTTHVRRWRLHRHSVGHGHLYQGTYKSFPVQEDDHFYTVCRTATPGGKSGRRSAWALNRPSAAAAGRKGAPNWTYPLFPALFPAPFPRRAQFFWRDIVAASAVSSVAAIELAVLANNGD